jgi:hypothetical protein
VRFSAFSRERFYATGADEFDQDGRCYIPVIARVFRIRHDLQIFDCVIRLVLVLVMDVFGREQQAAKMGLDD